ncbi:hypothetical protein [Pectobacterium versatile]|uniref:hypothetical protein n=1 Tax=Pectobacterium versatile TaxID=2488639 RepID=UPI001F49ED51|nr:hypothetical protein [Pectobacterium versatile]GKX40107.1 hypothetical protein SOASR014_38460 [Pectobacterium carotovorum subsp. carotovorum]GLX46313.1 hypothetical protein Pcaca01_39810 [Pectobacterium carotovorum subsp. carotovorum]
MKGVLNTTGPVPFSIGIEKINKNEFFHHEENHRNIGLTYSNFTEGTLRQRLKKNIINESKSVIRKMKRILCKNSK